jgi:hypothetical protein
MNGVGPRARWAASAVLAVVAVALLLSFGRAAPHRGVPVAAQTVAGQTVAAPTSPAPISTPTAARARVTTPSAPTTPAMNDGAPLRPDVAHGLTVVSADAFVRYYFAEASNYLKATGDGYAVRRASSPACSSCRGDITLFGAHNGRNGLLSGSYLYTNIDVRGVRSTGPRSAVVDVNVQTGRHFVRERKGGPAKAYPGGLQHLALTLVAVGNDWAVLDVMFR